MEKSQISEFKAKLEEEKLVLLEELQTVGVENPNLPEDFEPVAPVMDINEADRNEVADKIEEFGNNQAITRDLEIRLLEVKQALERIENGTYGICEVSGEPIETDRLGANPAATTCKSHLK